MVVGAMLLWVVFVAVEKGESSPAVACGSLVLGVSRLGEQRLGERGDKGDLGRV